MTSIANNIADILKTIPRNVRLVAVSKFKSDSEIMDAYNAGQRIFGESRVQELMTKYDALPDDIEWHMIGHLQRNKVKYIAPFIHMVQSIDSLMLLEELNKYALKRNRIIDCLLQIHIANEETKFGLSQAEATTLLEYSGFKDLQNIRIKGLMGMASQTVDQVQIAKEFQHLKVFFDLIKNKYFLDNINFNELSIGMSGDYQIAIKAGSTLIRIGSNIFGERNSK